MESSEFVFVDIFYQEVGDSSGVVGGDGGVGLDYLRLGKFF